MLRKLCLAVLVSGGLALPCGAQAPGYKARLDSFFTLLDQHSRSMCGVAMYKAGKPVYSRNIGYVKIPRAAAAGIPAQENSAYHIGSISKTFTATMIYQLIDEGKLQVDTRLSRFFPQLPEAGNMTVDHLLRHRSGIFSLTSDPAFDKWSGRPQSREAMLERVRGYRRDFAPGARYEYSNTNYLLLGYIVEMLDSTDYETALKKRITTPLQLQHTGVYRARTDDSAYVRTNSYARGNDSWEYVKQTDPSTSLGAGSVEASPSDLCRFMEALLTGRLISKASLARMTDMGKDRYGGGIVMIPFGQRKGFGHNGRIDGFTASAAYFPADSLSLAITVNGQNYPENDIAIAVLSMYYGLPNFKMPDFAGKKLPAETLDRYTGTYSTTLVPMSIKLSREGNELIAEPSGQPAIRLLAESETRFSYNTAGLVLEFDPVKEGNAKSFTLHQGGAQIPFTRQ